MGLYLMNYPLKQFDAPFPPSVNHYLGRNGKHSFLSPKAIKFNRDIYYLILMNGLNKKYSIPIEVHYDIWFPDNRKRDIANYEKVLTDALVKAGVMKDDHLVHKMVIQRMGIIKGGKVTISILPIRNL